MQLIPQKVFQAISYYRSFLFLGILNFPYIVLVFV